MLRGFRRVGPPAGCSVAGLCDTLSLNVSSPSDSWGRVYAGLGRPVAVAAGRRGLPSKESAKQRCSQHPPQSGSAISLLGSEPAHPRKRESTREIESSIPHRVAPSRNATPSGGLSAAAPATTYPPPDDPRPKYRPKRLRSDGPSGNSPGDPVRSDPTAPVSRSPPCATR